MTTTFNNFDKRNLNNLRNEMNALLAKYGAEANLEFDVGNMRFSQHEVKINVEAKVVGAKTRSDSVLESIMSIHNLRKEGPDGQILTGYNSRRYRYPFSYTDKHGRPMKCALDFAKTLFGKAA